MKVINLQLISLKNKKAATDQPYLAEHHIKLLGRLFKHLKEKAFF